jgi:hypothetical protein
MALKKILSIFQDASEQLQTRRGREELLGLPANKRNRKLNEVAKNNFYSTYPEFDDRGNKGSGDDYDFDGYIQFRMGNKYYCQFMEGESSLKKEYFRLCEEKYDEVDFRIIDADEVPVIYNLLKDYKDWTKFISLYPTSFKYMYASCWFYKYRSMYFYSGEEEKQKLRERDAVISTIKHLLAKGDIEFESIEQVYDASEECQMLILSRALNKLNANTFIESLDWQDFDENDVHNLQLDAGFEYDFWARVFRRKFNLISGLIDVNLNKLN